MPGLIPTHAGKTKPVNNALQGLGAHPHSRGENPKPETTRYPPEGSSPLTRGKRPLRACEPGSTGLIPTHAGKTRGRKPPPATCWAHPHSRGENKHGCRAFPGIMGSSPLTRGKRTSLGTAWIDVGLIPTHAGKTGWHVLDHPHGGAHPHSRGENPRPAIRTATKPGSSPLTRGKLNDGFVCGGLQGLIPTHAGKTTACAQPSKTAWAHPHSRGENRDHAGRGPVLVGSSPLTRGKRGG